MKQLVLIKFLSAATMVCAIPIIVVALLFYLVLKA